MYNVWDDVKQVMDEAEMAIANAVDLYNKALDLAQSQCDCELDNHLIVLEIQNRLDAIKPVKK